MQRVVTRESKFYNGNTKLPVYSVQASRYDTQEMVMILLDPDLDSDLVCKTQPVNIEQNATFIVNLSELNNPKDIYVDDMGSWKYNGVYRTWITVEEDGFVVFQGKKQPVDTPDGSLYHIVKKYFHHKTSSDFKKTIAFLSGKLKLQA